MKKRNPLRKKRKRVVEKRESGRAWRLKYDRKEDLDPSDGLPRDRHGSQAATELFLPLKSSHKKRTRDQGDGSVDKNTLCSSPSSSP